MSGGFALDDAAWTSRWRPRRVADKAVLALGLLACAVGLPPWPGGALAGLAALLVLLFGARVRPGLLLRSFAGPGAFIVLGGLTILVSVGWDGGPRLAVTPATLADAATVTIRAVAGTLSVFVLATTTPMVDLLGALRRARVPDACVEVASLMYRLVFLLLDSLHTIRAAQASRLGYVDRRRAMASSAQLVGAVFLRAWERARRLEDGLAGRGYTTALRTLDPPAAGSPRFVAASLALVAALLGASVAWAVTGLPALPAVGGAR